MAFQNWQPLLSRFGQQHGINPLFLQGIVNAESSGNPQATGPMTKYGQARGLMQLMPGTYGDMQKSQGLGSDIFDPANNIGAGAAYYAQMRDMFGSDEDALAAYNWGPGNMQKWIAGGRDPAQMPEETKAYVAKIMSGAPSSLYGGDFQTAAGGPQQALAPIPNGGTITPRPQPQALRNAAVPQETIQQAEAMGDMLGQTPGDLLNVNDVPADDPLAQVRTQARGQALLQAGAALLSASGWSQRPISMGEALGGALQAGQAGYQSTIDQSLKDEYMRSQIAAMDRKGGNLMNFARAIGMPIAGDEQMQTAAGPSDAGGGDAGGTGDAPAGAASGSLWSKLNEQQQLTVQAMLANGDIEKAETFLADLSTREGGGSYRDATPQEKEAWGYDPAQPVQVNEVTGERKVSGTSRTQVQFERADKLRDEFQKTTAFQNYNTVAPFYNEIQTAAKTPGGLNDVSMLYSFIKLLDPGSVVKRDEISLTNAAAPGAEQVGLMYQKLARGGALTPTELEQLPIIAKRLYDDRRKALDSTAEYYVGLGERYGLERGDIIAPALEGVEPVERKPAPDPEFEGGDAAIPTAPAPTSQAPAEEPMLPSDGVAPQAGEGAPKVAPDANAVKFGATQGMMTVEDMNNAPAGKQVWMGGKLYYKKPNGNWDTVFSEATIPAGQ